MNSVIWSDYDAVLFDLDGVITATARVHAAAWKAAFDAFLEELGPGHEPFDRDRDYRLHVDGRARYDGVAEFLKSRFIELPWGDPSDAPGHDTVCALGNLKNQMFGTILLEQGADVYPGSAALLDHLDGIGVAYAVVSASANAGPILESVGMLGRFRARVDGIVAAELGLRGKPEPDPFLEGARRLGVDPARAVVVEDAVSGVAAGKAGGFGLVVGIDRHDDPDGLREAGADLVVADLGELVGGGWGPRSFAAGPWDLTRDGLPDDVGVDETLFALGNGNLGVRGSFSQGDPRHEPGTLLNGFHETWPIEYPEPAHGYATVGQTIVYVPDATELAVGWDGHRLELADAAVTRHLDLRTGQLTTTAAWPELTATWRRLVSLRHANVLAMELTIEPAAAGELSVDHSVVNRQDLDQSDGAKADPRRAARFDRRVLVAGDQIADDTTAVLTFRTAGSDLPLAVASIVNGSLHADGWVTGPDRASLRLTRQVAPGESHRVEVAVMYRRDDDAAAAASEVAGIEDFKTLADGQQSDFAARWDDSDIVIDGDPVAQQAVRFAVFQLHQASASVSGHGIPAKGVTGQAYEGHHFWDSDVFVLPFLAATNPAAAREVIRWRHSLLPAARQRAATMALRGALYPWRTITGDEASAFFEAGTAQFHIDADVTYGLRTYLDWTGDDELLWECGVEIAVETARMWASLGFWDGTAFHIHGVTGPDEYTALVNDNAYTNQMARMNLRFAASVTARMRDERAADFAALTERLGLDEAEPAEWLRIADGMVVIFDVERGITAQDATFLDLEPWDWTTPPELYPLLLHFHPLVIYRHRMLKQADTVMAHFLLPEDTVLERRRADFDYYDRITTGDSSLSSAIQSTVAVRVGRAELAWDYFRHAATLDLADRAGNTADGIHLANAAGVWLAVVRGFAGVELGTDGVVHIDPRLPALWRSLTIRTRLRGEPMEITIP